MNKKSLMVGGLLFSAVILAGCFGKTQDKKNDEFTIASCNDYIELMRCVADKSGESSTVANSVIDQAVATWKNLPEDELNKVCAGALETASSYASTYEQKGCSVPNSNANLSGQDIVPEENTPDPAVIDAISGEANDSTGVNTTINNTKDKDTNTKDTEVVDTVVKEIVTGSATNQ